jgi:hypothetical protein
MDNMLLCVAVHISKDLSRHIFCQKPKYKKLLFRGKLLKIFRNIRRLFCIQPFLQQGIFPCLHPFVQLLKKLLHLIHFLHPIPNKKAPSPPQQGSTQCVFFLETGAENQSAAKIFPADNSGQPHIYDSALFPSVLSP